MKSYKFREVRKILEDHGWHVVRIVGNHHIFRKEGNPASVAVPAHNKDIKPGTLRAIAKQTEIFFP